MWLIQTIAALTVGFIAGLFTCKRASRWCPEHGEVLRCSECVRQTPPLARCCPTCRRLWTPNGAPPTAWNAPTRRLPVVGDAPLITRAGSWRVGRRRRDQ